MENQSQLPTPTPGDIAGYTGTGAHRPQTMDARPGLPTLPGKAAEHSFIALPDPFDGRKENYRRFQRQFSLFLMANWTKFKEKESMIWFTLSYTKGGDAELWANSYVNRAMESNNWGTWEDFLDQLAKDFRNIEEPWKALEELEKLQQGKKLATEYFLKFEQLADLVGINLNHYPKTALYIKRNMQHVLIDQLYQSDNPPSTYQEYKRRITAMDEMRRRQEMHKNPQWIVTPHT
jgi:hypothetical protein